MSASPTPILPDINEDLFIPDVIRFNLVNNPQQPFFTYGNPENGSVTVITHAEFGRAAHRVAHILQPKPISKPDVVAFIALSDAILYQAINAGLIVAGLIPFPISPRNSPAAVVNLLQKTSCHRLVTTQTTLKPLIDGIKAHLREHDPEFVLEVEEVPALSEVYPYLGHETADHPFEPHPGPLVRPSKDDVCMYLHSSGSTGFPKAIPETHLAFIQWSSYPGVTEFRDYKTRLTMGCFALPPFHTLGIYMQLMNPLYGIVPIALYPPTATTPSALPVMPSPANIIDHTRVTKSNCIVIIPAILQIWSTSPESVKFLSTLEFIAYSGGSLAPKIGAQLTDGGIRLCPVYGGTEFGAPCHVFTTKDPHDWQYMKFHERAKVRWEPQGDGTYECHLLTWPSHQLMVENLPDVKGYATSDLWDPHPTKEGLWRMCVFHDPGPSRSGSDIPDLIIRVGRIDDVIVHSSGEKTVPAPMEDIIASSPLVQGVVMFGRERDEAGVLIEVKPNEQIDVRDAEQIAKLRNKLWSIIEEANAAAPAFSRIFKEMILIASKEKPLPRTGKGTVMRKAAIVAYENEINEVYEAVESSIKEAETTPPASFARSDLESWLLSQAIDLSSKQNITPSSDLFEHGFDSLSATFLRHRIVSALRSSEDENIKAAANAITQDTVYSFPTIEQLVSHILGLIAHPNGSATVSHEQLITEMIEKYSEGLTPLSRSPDRQTPSDALVVLLTGSSGNLGSEILAALVRDERVKRVYALNRPASDSVSMLERHKARFADRGFDTSLLKSLKLVFLSADTAQPELGLAKETYQELSGSITTIIHAAWRLDFNLSLPSYDSNVRGTRHLIDLARSAKNASIIRFLFTSSVASAQSWDVTSGPYPEEVVEDPKFAVGNGYGESKYVAERILAKSGLWATSFRIGQVSGGEPNGAWATSDWFPILVKSSLALGALPAGEGVISWLPMDAVAKSILDVAFADHEAPKALNVVHPKPIPWKDMMTAVRDVLAKKLSRTLELVDFGDWFTRLEDASKTAGEAKLQQVPAIKLLNFFQAISRADAAMACSGETEAESGGLASFATNKMESVSPTLADLRPLESQDVERWIGYWIGLSFLS